MHRATGDGRVRVFVIAAREIASAVRSTLAQTLN
jgi:hypothetical protein